MDNFFIYWLVWLNLILINAKIWDKIDVSWWWLLSPMIVLLCIGSFAYFTRGKTTTANAQGLRQTVETYSELIDRITRKGSH